MKGRSQVADLRRVAMPSFDLICGEDTVAPQTGNGRDELHISFSGLCRGVKDQVYLGMDVPDLVRVVVQAMARTRYPRRRWCTH